MAQIRYWIWLTSLVGLRPLAMHAAIEHFGSPMETYYAPAGGYDAVPELNAKDRSLLENKDMSRTEEILEVCQQKGIHILTLQDAGYPERLRQIADPPPVLYVRGSLPYLDELPVIAVVGTRKASAYGIKMALRLGQEITACGGCVVTGMALGIDGAAARGAITAGGACVGVLGTAIDVDYPASNTSLIRDVAATGAIVSEYPPGYPTMPENFPRRNRIISGLSCGTCVVEAPRRSGALITANLSLDQGRDLFAVPGNADSETSFGTNALLQDCAKAVTCGMDILCEYAGLFPGRIREKTVEFAPPEPARTEAPAAKTVIDKPEGIPYIDVESRLAPFTEDQKTLLRILAKGESHVDALIALSGFSTAKVLSAMTILTIKGAVRSLPGKRYELNLK
ncbi:MAG: DNA-processing protein DprA [Oscillospiraceae bacterium]|nr:DNA-processing protein DprA [Oscillospiraceae bacterium]